MKDCKEETLTVRGRKVRLFRGGVGPPLLFLHDTFCPSWLPIQQILAEHYEVFVPATSRLRRIGGWLCSV